MLDKSIFGAKLLTLAEIFKNNRFVIPDYQRGYAWEQKQVEELLGDIKLLISDGVQMKHYTGTLVLTRHNDNLLDTVYHVVDGQQRLTTISILLRVLADQLPQEQQVEFLQKYVWRGSKGSEVPVLQLNADTRSYFENVVIAHHVSKSEQKSIESHERLYQCKRIVEKWFEQHKGNPVNEILNTVENELGFLVYAPEELSEVGVMFEVINNRGKALSELEKVKNYLIYCCVKLKATTLREKIDKAWSEILRNLNIAQKTSVGDESGFLRYCLTVFFKASKGDGQYGYDFLKQNFPIDSRTKDEEQRLIIVDQLSSFVDFLKEAALWYARLYGRQRDSGLEQAFFSVLDQFRGQDRHATIMPLILSILIKNITTVQQKIHLLKLIEILNFRVYMAKGITARNDTGQAELYGFASDYFHDELLGTFDASLVNSNELGAPSIQTQEESLEYKLVEFTNRLSAETRFVNSFKLERDSYDDYYKWSSLKYFLMSYEAFLRPDKTINIDSILLSRSEVKSGDFFSVEHFWAKQNRSDENNRFIDEFEKRRLGNFTLLELRPNIQSSNDGIEDKVLRYTSRTDGDATDLIQVQELCKDAKLIIKKLEGRRRGKDYFYDLARLTNDAQEKRFCEFALNRWSTKNYIGHDFVCKKRESAE